MWMNHDTDVAFHVVENRSARQIGRGMFLSGRPAKVCRVNQYQIFAGLSVQTGYVGNEKRWIHR
jgi:hypothetical protein